MARKRQAVTIKHVAADAGVSLQTVSRVINNEPNVRPAMKERVQASIDKLGYVPSIAAQRMSGSRSYLILALNDRDLTIADWRAREGRDWVDQMLLGGMLTCAQHGYRMLIELVDTHDDHVERELGAALAALQPDGVILTPPHSENPVICGLLAERGIRFRTGRLDTGRAGLRYHHGRHLQRAAGYRSPDRARTRAYRLHCRAGRFQPRQSAHRRVARGNGRCGPGHRRPMHTRRLRVRKRHGRGQDAARACRTADSNYRQQRPDGFGDAGNRTRLRVSRFRTICRWSASTIRPSCDSPSRRSPPSTSRSPPPLRGQ